MIDTLIAFAHKASICFGVLFVVDVLIIAMCLMMSASEDRRWGDK